ncbi:hypothetical protein MKW98_016567 [Papaver atlanticum]|uniref:RRM domain-containing protein n=1 Tax=Papaver atlanticum TaxID=357466 RepID=A0AAD4RZ77_9MAGN|nr:hypothetical protein MKW98_001652 [Papaver atlanticum]KAI3908407.1 hypothetical protein MKW98_016567 [Papaver atlanticum]
MDSQFHNQNHKFLNPLYQSQPSIPYHHHTSLITDSSIISPVSIHHHHPPYDPSNYIPLQHNNLINYSENKNSDINTLFISGLPDDVKAREIHNLFRRRQGFEFSQLKYTGRGNQVVAFATFLNHHTAMAAMNSLNGATFDPQSGACLHIELARSNSRTKRVREGAGGYLVIDKRGKLSADEKETSSNDGDDGFDEPSGNDNPDSSNKDGLTTAESADTTIHGDDGGAPANDQSENAAKGELQPCSTFFIANLGPNCTEDELRQALSPYPGFRIVKMRAKRGMPVAFADFEEVEQANEAMQSLQGTTLPSSDRGGLHLEYARSKMRKA